MFTQRYLCTPGDVEQGCATPPVICERMWAGGAVQCVRRLRGPLAADSPPDWANNVGMRGCVCHGMLPQPHCMDTGPFFPPYCLPPPPPPIPPSLPPSAGGVPKARALGDGSKASTSGYKEIHDADSAGKDRKVGDASSAVGGGSGGDDERRIYLVVVLKARQPSARQQHFSRRDGEGVTLVKYLAAPPPHPGSPACRGSVGFLPGDLSVTLSRCIAIQGLWRVPQPDHEIGQLSCLPHPSTSSRSGNGTV